MQKGLDPLVTTTCMKCRRARSRYYGTWGEEGLCRPCILAMEPPVRRRVLREMHPAERKRWQLDELEEKVRRQEQARAREEAPDAPPEEPPSRPGPADRYTQPYRAAGTPRPEPGARRERRRDSRQAAEVPVRFTVVPGAGAIAARFRGRTFHAVSKDLSDGGLRVLVRDPLALEIPAGCTLHLEITVPPDHAVVRCAAALRNVVRDTRGTDAGCLCVQFLPTAGGTLAPLRRLLARGRAGGAG